MFFTKRSRNTSEKKGGEFILSNKRFLNLNKNIPLAPTIKETINYTYIENILPLERQDYIEKYAKFVLYAAA